MGNHTSKSKTFDENSKNPEKLPLEQKIFENYSLYSKNIKDHQKNLYAWPFLSSKLKSKEISTVSFSPCSNLIGYSSEANVVIEKAHSTKKKVLFKYKHPKTVKTLTFSLNGNLIASGSKDLRIRIWDFNKSNKEIRILEYHSEVNSLSFSPGSNHLAAGYENGVLIIWDLKEETEPVLLSEHSSFISCVGYSPDGTMIATGSNDKTLKIWNPFQQKVEFSLIDKYSYPISCLSFSPDSHFIATARQTILNVWDLKSKTIEFLQIEIQIIFTTLMFSPDGLHIAAGFTDKKIKIWNFQKKRKQFSLNGHTSSITSLSFSNDGRYLSTASKDRTIKIWDFQQTKSEVTTEIYSDIIHSITFSQDGRFLAAGSGTSSIKVWTWPNKTEEFYLYGHLDKVNCLVFSPDSKKLVSGSKDSLIKVWNINKRIEEFSLFGHNLSVNSLCFTNDGKFIVSGSSELCIKLWDLEERIEKYSFIGHVFLVSCISISPVGDFFASGSFDQSIKVWNYIRYTEEFSFLLDFPVNCLVYVRNGTRLAVGTSEFIIYILSIQEKAIEFYLQGHSGSINCLLYLSEHILVSGSNDQSVRVWNLQEQKEQYKLFGNIVSIKSLAISPDKNFLAACTGGLIINIWNLQKTTISSNIFGQSCWSNHYPYSPRGRYLIQTQDSKSSKSKKNQFTVFDLYKQKTIITIRDYFLSLRMFSFSNDDKLLAISSNTKLVRIYDLEKNIEKFKFSFHRSVIVQTCFSYDSKFLAIGFKDSIQIWSLETGKKYKKIKNIFSVVSLSFSPDSKFLVAYISFTIFFYSLPSCVSDFSIILATQNIVKRLKFSEDSKFLLAYTDFECFQFNYINKLFYILDDTLVNIIHKGNDLKSLYKHSLPILACSQYYPEGQRSMMSLQSKYRDILSESIIYFQAKKSIKILKYLIKFTKIDIFPDFIDSKALTILHQHFQQKDLLLTESSENYLEMIIYFFQDMLENSQDQEIASCSLNQLKSIKEFKRKQINFQTYFQNSEMKNKILIEELYEWKQLGSESGLFFETSYFEAKYLLDEVLIKKISISSDIFQVYMKKILFQLEKEAKCYELLNQIKNQPHCFNIYYGSIRIRNDFYLIIKNHGMRLDSFICYFREEGNRVPLFNVAVAVLNLLRSFSMMEGKNIFHRNIEPQSFLIDENYNITIINFLHCAVKTEDGFYEPEDYLLPKRSENYKAPEELSCVSEFDVEKCDVFSLGLVILEFATLEKIEIIRENIDFFIDWIRNSDLNWLEKLLKKMLSDRPEFRMSFKDLIIFIENDISETMSNSIA